MLVKNPRSSGPLPRQHRVNYSPLYSKDNAVDGNPSTTWSTLFSFFKKDEFITLDLGEIKRISWFTMQAASTLFGTDYFPVNFTIEISSDTVTWDKISTEQGYAPPLQSTHSDSWDFKGLECRYIRVYITKAKNILFFFKMAQIAEIEVYGCNTTEALRSLLKRMLLWLRRRMVIQKRVLHRNQVGKKSLSRCSLQFRANQQ